MGSVQVNHSHDHDGNKRRDLSARSITGSDRLHEQETNILLHNNLHSFIELKPNPDMKMDSEGES